MNVAEAVAPAAWRNPLLSSRLPELDGLRGFAILLVVFFHYFSNNQVSPGTWQSYALLPLRLFWSGVDLFFVLSGFLIGGILLDTKGDRTYFQKFYLRRSRRILPVYFIWFILFIAGLKVTQAIGSSTLKPIFNSDLPTFSYSIFLQNFFTALRLSHGAQWMGVTWSLAVEEQF